MTARTDPVLRFGAASPLGLPGFTRADLSAYSGAGAAPVVRELVQNSLDAARPGQTVQIRFTATSVPQTEIPGFGEYSDAFAMAREYRQSLPGRLSHDESTIIERIEAQLACEQVPVLFCADNGIGLNRDRMAALLSVGNTDKGGGGAGSFGIGHLTAFAASDLRYVLYGSRYDDGREREIASGHAILAGRKNRREWISEQGCWQLPPRRKGSELDWMAGEMFPTTLPTMMAPHMPTGTGTVVAAIGFNDFRREAADPSVCDQILQAVAANFLYAIHAGRLTVKAKPADAADWQVLNAETLAATLEGIAGQMRAASAGHISGRQAWSAYRTLCASAAQSVPDLVPGVEFKHREIESADGESTQIHFFRRGMWIESRWTKFVKSDFLDHVPFDAVVNLADGEMESLVRSAENPSHLKIEVNRLQPTQRSQLNALKRQLSETIRAVVPKQVNGGEFLPAGFAELRGDMVRKAEKIPRRRHPSSGEEETTTTRPSTPGKRTGRPGAARQPKTGTAPRYRHVHRFDADAQRIDVDLEYCETAGQDAAVGVRVRFLSASDPTCDVQEQPDWLRLRSVSDGDGTLLAASANGTGDLELVVDAVAGRRQLNILLDAHSAVSPAWDHFIDIDLVKRKSLAAEQEASAS